MFAPARSKQTCTIWLRGRAHKHTTQALACTSDVSSLVSRLARSVLNEKKHMHHQHTSSFTHRPHGPSDGTLSGRWHRKTWFARSAHPRCPLMREPPPSREKSAVRMLGTRRKSADVAGQRLQVLSIHVRRDSSHAGKVCTNGKTCGRYAGRFRGNSSQLYRGGHVKLVFGGRNVGGSAVNANMERPHGSGSGAHLDAQVGGRACVWG